MPVWRPVGTLTAAGAFGGGLVALVWVNGQPDIGVWGNAALLDFLILVGVGAICGGCAAAAVALVVSLSRKLPGPRIALVMLLLTVISGAVFTGLLAKSDPIRRTRGTARIGDAGPPDVIVVIYDAVRADIIADENGLVPEWLPRLQELSREAVVFRNAASPSPWTLPSHASLFTGLSPLDHGAVEEFPVLESNLLTLAEILEQRGYHTAGLVTNPWLARDRGFDQGFRTYLELWRPREVPLAYRVASRFLHRDKGAILASRAAEVLIQRLDESTPLFLFINLVDAHPPYWAPEPERLSRVPPQILDKGVEPARVPQRWMDVLTGKSLLSGDDLAVLRTLNEEEVVYLDRHLGRLLDALDKAGRLDGALVVVTSDHGAHLGENRMIGSGFDLTEEMLRIPLVVRLPQGRDAGTVRDDPVYLHDLFPTILELSGSAPALLGSETPRGAVSLFGDDTRSSGLSAFSRPVNMLNNLWQQYPQYDASSFDRRMLALRSERFKLVWTSGREELYGIDPPAEDSDLSAVEPTVLVEHQRLMSEALEGTPEDAWDRCLRRTRSRPQDIVSDEETIESLRSLGYVSGN